MEQGGKRLEQVAAKLKGGETIDEISVREFVSWFGAERRGSSIVAGIVAELNRVGLETRPDFRSAYVETPLEIALVASPVVEIGREATTIPRITESSLADDDAIEHRYIDPTHRIRRLKAANNVPTHVSPSTPLSEIATIMMLNDFSHLPVMTNERDVKGVVSWASIGEKYCQGRPTATAKDVMIREQVIDADESFFAVLPIVAEHQYVLVRGDDRKISGIITQYDLNIQFHNFSEPFLLLNEIEDQLRLVLDRHLSKSDLQSGVDPSDRSRKIQRAADLTFGEYLRVLEEPGKWKKLNLTIDRSTFCAALDDIRRIRNEVMHFDPEGIAEEDLESLRNFRKFLAKLADGNAT